MTYTLDVTGSSIENKILGDSVSVTPIASGYQRVIPLTGPFFEQDCVVRYTPVSGARRTLVKDVDYYLGYPYIAASNACKLAIYGAIVLVDPSTNGTITYSVQTLGGDYEITNTKVSLILTGETRDPTITSWEMVNTARNYALAVFPVVDYAYTRASSVEFRKMVDLLDEAGLSIHLRPTFLPTPGDTVYIPTAAEVGLGNVSNYRTATSVEAAAGLADNLLVTPAGVRSCLVNQLTTMLSAMGYQLPITYAGSLVVSNSTQLYTYDGDTYAARTGTTPFTTSGSFEYDKFMLVNATKRDSWVSQTYTITGTESKNALGDTIIPITAAVIKCAVKIRVILNSICELVREVDVKLDGNNLLVNYPLSVGDSICIKIKQLKSRASDARSYSKSFAVTNTATSYTLTDLQGINPSDLEVRLNDVFILDANVGDYSINGTALSINFPKAIGDTIEVQDIDSIPQIGIQSLRSITYSTVA